MLVGPYWERNIFGPAQKKLSSSLTAIDINHHRIAKVMKIDSVVVDALRTYRNGVGYQALMEMVDQAIFKLSLL